MEHARSDHAPGDSDRPEAPLSRRTAWLVAAGVLAVTVAIVGYKLGSRPWAADELYTLLEMDLLDESVHPPADSPDRMEVRITKLTPMWYLTQGTLLRWIVPTELNARLLPAACGVGAVMALYGFGLARRGLAFALALVLMADGSQVFVWLAQQNRFYAMALLLLVLTVAAVWSRASGAWMAALTAVLALLTVLTHSLLIVPLGLMLVAACVAYPLGWIPRPVAVRSIVCGMVAAVVYVFHVRRLAGGWSGVGFEWTPPLVSFVSHVGVPTAALALFGGLVALIARDERRSAGWWALFAAGSVAFVALSPRLMPVWNARYALLFALPVWVMAAVGIEWIGRRMPSRWAVFGWYAAVAVLLAPKPASHFLDGSRHDLRAAAAVVEREIAPGEPVLTNMPMETRYYLPKRLRHKVRFWDETRPLPASAALVVQATNAWQPVPHFSGRPVWPLAQVGKRRLDEQSYVVRVLRVGAEDGSPGEVPPDGAP